MTILRPLALLGALAGALIPATLGGCGDGDDRPPSPLHVVSISPADGELGVADTVTITITFTVAVAPESLDGTNQILLMDENGRQLAALVEVDADDPTIVTLDPTSSLAADATFGLAVRNHVTTPNGEPLAAPVAVLFSTGQVLGSIPGFPPFDDSAIPPAPPGSFTAAAGTMVTARRDAVSASLADGRVWIHGGRDLAGAPISSTEMFSFTDTKFTATALTGSIPAARYGHTAERLTDNRVMITGGHGASAVLGDSPIFDPATETFGATPATLNTARADHTAVVLNNGQVLVAGGTDGTNAISVCELFNPSTGTWTTTGTLAVARADHAAVKLADGRVLVSGGNSGTATLASSEIYDPATGTWTGSANLAGARQDHTATLMPTGAAAGFVVVAGGWESGASASVRNNAELFDPSGGGGAGVFTAINNTMSTGRVHHTATFLPATGELLIAGGSSSVPPQVNGSCTALNTAERLDPAATAVAIPGVPPITGYFGVVAQATFTVTQDADANQTFMSNGLTAGRSAHIAALLANGTVLLAGGLDTTVAGASTGNLRVLNTAERFTP